MFKDKKTLSIKATQTRDFYILVTPFIIFFTISILIPLIWSLYISTTNFSGFNLTNLKNVGIKNFERVFSDNDSIYSLLNTFKISLFSLPLVVSVGLLLALLLNNKVKYLGTFRTIFYYPAVIPIIAVGLIWFNLYSKSNGVFNDIIVRLGMDAFEFRKGGTAVVSLLVVLLWGSGASLLIFLSALKNVPIELYESADIEGANTMQKFWRITFPIISPTIYFQIITSFIYNLQLHVQPVMIFAETGQSVGGTGTLVSVPTRSVYTTVTHIYQQVFVYSRYGYGVAIVWITFIAILILTQIIMRTSRLWVFYEVDQDQRVR